MMLGTHLLSVWQSSFLGWVPRFFPSVGTYVIYVTLIIEMYVSRIVIYCMYVQYIYSSVIGVEVRGKQCDFKGDMGAMGGKPSGGAPRHERAIFYQHAKYCTLKGVL